MATIQCGTGVGRTYQDDPDNTSLLSAKGTIGGVDLHWTYPGINPQSVAYVTIYRSTSWTEGTGREIARMAGTYFYDRTENYETTYYYWIRITSVNGTENDLIGPVSAKAVDPAEVNLKNLTEKIGETQLAQSIKSKIDEIDINKSLVNKELLRQAQIDDELGATINSVQAHSNESRAMLDEEVLVRSNAIDSVAKSLNTLAAEVGDNKAAIQQESTARVNEYEAFTSEVTTWQTSFEARMASVQQIVETGVDDNGENVMWSLRASATDDNGNVLVGGIGLGIEGGTVNVGFQADRFWVAEPGMDFSQDLVPFVIENGKTIIKKAVIPDASIGTVKIENGFLDNLTANHGTFRGNIHVSSGDSGERLEITNDRISVYDENGILRARMGRL